MVTADNTTDNRLVEENDVYTESQVIMTAVRLVAPFTLTYGFFLTFHGANAPGGAFQGGAVVGATVLMIAFAFGIAPTRQWVENSLLVGLMTGGTVFFGLFGLSGLVTGGSFLDHKLFYLFGLEKGTKWGIEAVEIGGIFLIVAGTIVGLFLVTAAGFKQLDDGGAYQ